MSAFFLDILAQSFDQVLILDLLIWFVNAFEVFSSVYGCESWVKSLVIEVVHTKLISHLENCFLSGIMLDLKNLGKV